LKAHVLLKKSIKSFDRNNKIINSSHPLKRHLAQVNGIPTYKYNGGYGHVVYISYPDPLGSRTTYSRASSEGEL
jgi:hypothetical protein